MVGVHHDGYNYAAHPRASETDITPPASVAPAIRVLALGLSLSSFFAITFVACVIFDLWFPTWAMNAVWAPLLPGFTWINWTSFFLGLAESAAYGWYIALIFGSIHNIISAKLYQTDERRR